MDDVWVDGNELAGAMQEFFAIDMTLARGRCARCGRSAVLAECRVYDRAPGLVARCCGCEAVLVTVVRGPGRAWLDMRGLSCLEFAVPQPVSAAG